MKKQYVISLFIFFYSVSAFAETTPFEEYFSEENQKIILDYVSKDFLDPFSARYKDISVKEGTLTLMMRRVDPDFPGYYGIVDVCGKFNAKNLHGAYTGWKQFYLSTSMTENEYSGRVIPSDLALESLDDTDIQKIVETNQAIKNCRTDDERDKIHASCMSALKKQTEHYRKMIQILSKCSRPKGPMMLSCLEEKDIEDRKRYEKQQSEICNTPNDLTIEQTSEKVKALKNATAEANKLTNMIK